MPQKPTLKKLASSFDSSIILNQRTEKRDKNAAFWHFHPELELIYVNSGKGKRHIGNHMAYFNDSQLLLIGANLPHNGFINSFSANGKETLIQFKDDFLGATFLLKPELSEIVKLFERAKKGVLFDQEVEYIVGMRIESLHLYSGLERIIKFLDILNILAKTEHYTLLNADGFAFETHQQDNNKIEVIYKYINTNFKEDIKLEEVSSLVSMTVPAFCRYFKKATNKTFTQFLNEYRIVHATKLLSETQSSVTDICFECGYNTFSHFNKQFKKYTGKNALNYRQEIKQMIQA